MIEVKVNGKVYVFEEHSEIIDQLDTQAVEVRDEPDLQQNQMQQIEVKTSKGTIKAEKSPNSDNTGIFLFYEDSEGVEVSSLVLEEAEAEGMVLARVWRPENKDQDPAYVIRMEAP